jgi:DNA processing protein
LRGFRLSFIVCAVSLSPAVPTEYSSAQTASPFEREAWLRLAFVGLPAGRAASALRKWSTPEALLDAATRGDEGDLLATPGLTPVSVERLRDAATRDLAKALAAMEEYSIRLLLQEDEEYPRALKSIPDPPLYLFARGSVLSRDETAVAIVGTRHATEYGRGLAHRLAQDLAQRGVTVVSGLARGIDTFAHKGALEGGGRTFAVCGCGLDVVYPTENKQLMIEISQSGAALSEFAPTVHPEAWHFPARNRIISGLSAGTIVVEAAERSGALITADFAMEQGREVFAVPGNVHKTQSRGCHALIKQGATLIESADDVLAALNNRALPFVEEREEKGNESTPAGKSSRAPQLRDDLTAEQNRIWLALDVEPRHIDAVAQEAALGAAEVNAALVIFELRGLAKRFPGNAFARVEN